MEKTVGIITYHAAHNYGSVLQAYALQKVVSSFGYKCTLINFRTARQKQMYLPCFKKGPYITRVKRLLSHLPFVFDIMRKYSLFEDFIGSVPHTEKEYSTLLELEEDIPIFDFYISGSDQIWNCTCEDFDWAFFLPFVKVGKKIAYASSMGPTPFEHVSSEDLSQIIPLLENYDHISVREDITAKRIGPINRVNLPVVLDPTLLVSQEEWLKVIDESPIIKGHYILLYVPFYREEAYELAYKLSVRYNLRVVVTQHYGIRNRLKWKTFIYHCAVGPKEFLNLCKHATFTCGYSFHLVAFSIIFNVPFVALNVNADSRVSNLLSLIGRSNIELIDDTFYTINNNVQLKNKIKDSINMLFEYLQ